MKKIVSALLCVFVSVIVSAQVRYEWGDKFNYNSPEETNPQLVFTDNYNSYLLTITNVHGMLSTHKVTVRKFDQKNQMIGTFTQDWKQLDNGTLYNFIGCKELNDHQVAVFAESYSGKEKKKDVYKYVFDKADGKFTTSLVVSWPIESAMKSGTTDFEISDNGRYIGIINERDGSKKEAVSDEVLILDGSNASVLWKKQVPLEEKVYDRAFTVTNSGKAVLLRAAKGLKLSNYLVVVSEDKQEEKQFEEEVMLQDPKAISIGQADYLIDFNFAAKGLRNGDYESLMMYDLGNGKILKNNKIKEFNALKDITGIKFPKVFLQNNEIHLFVEARVKAGTRQTKLNPMSSFTTEEPFYKFGPSYLIVMSFEGEVKFMKALQTDYSAMADFYHSFGLANIDGKYYLNAGNLYRIFQQPFDRSDPKEIIPTKEAGKDPFFSNSHQYISQVMAYVKDAKRLVLCRTFTDNKMALVSIVGFPY